MLHFMPEAKIQDLAQTLGIHRVSFARLARLNGILGLRRTPTNRWMVADKKAFDGFAKQYREAASIRSRKISTLNRDLSNGLCAAVRFSKDRFPADAELRADWEGEIRRLAAPASEADRLRKRRSANGLSAIQRPPVAYVRILPGQRPRGAELSARPGHRTLRREVPAGVILAACIVR
jgi:hypothetical protein